MYICMYMSVVVLYEYL